MMGHDHPESKVKKMSIINLITYVTLMFLDLIYSF